MRKIRVIFTLMITFALGFTLLSGVQSLKLEAAVPTNVGVIDGTVPDWVQGHEASVQQKFADAYTEGGFTLTPTQNVQSVELDKTRVMLYQIISTEGAIILNERDGKAFYTKNIDGINAYLALLGTPNESIILGIVTVDLVEYFITDKGVIYFEGGVMETYTHQIGKGTTLKVFSSGPAPVETFTENVVLNDFNIAYKFAENYMVSLGLPTSEVSMQDYTTIDLGNLNGIPTGTSSAKQYYMQSFENGYIMMNSHGENIQYGAAPIQKDFYDAVALISGNSDFSLTGTPVSVEMNIGGVRYQNFEFGYVKLVDGVAQYVDRLVVDS